MRSDGKILKVSTFSVLCSASVTLVLFRLQFRHLVRKWGADVAFSPMITADSFTKSAKARAADFSTDSGERNEDCHGILSALSDYVSTQQTITLLWSSSVLVLHHFSLKLQNMLRSKQQEKQSVDHERPIFVVVSAMGLTSTVDVLKGTWTRGTLC